MDDYNKLLKTSLDLKQKRADRYKEISRDRLYKISKKKIQTTMIGALSSVEAHFGFLWGIGSDESPTPEQEQIKAIFEEARSEILDRGNTQIRNLEAEIANYDINWKRYSINLPVAITQGENDE